MLELSPGHFWPHCSDGSLIDPRTDGRNPVSENKEFGLYLLIHCLVLNHWTVLLDDVHGL